MICSKCGKNQAVYHSVISVNGVSHEEHLCSDCYSGKSNRFSQFVEECFLSPFDAFDMLLPIGYYVNNNGTESVNNYTKFDKNSDYYANYKNILDDAQKSVSKGADKIREERKQNPNFETIQKLKIELAHAVEMEEYEKAGEIKKKIDKLNKENNDAK